MAVVLVAVLQWLLMIMDGDLVVRVPPPPPRPGSRRRSNSLELGTIKGLGSWPNNGRLPTRVITSVALPPPSIGLDHQVVGWTAAAPQ